jgi:hypothetical protein
MSQGAADDKYTALFLQLILSFQSAAWQQLGKIKNPFTDKVERNLDQARHSIDMLEMFRVKCQGNLSDDEKSFLNRTISELQLNFVAEVNRAEKEAKEKPDQTEKEAVDTEKNTKKESKKAAQPSKKKTSKKRNLK